MQTGNLVTAGKNLLKSDEMTQSGSNNVSDYVHLPSGTYTFSASGGPFDQIIFESATHVFSSDNFTVSKATFTLPYPEEIRVRTWNNNADSVFTFDPQIELGSTATAYEPPNVTTTPLPEVELRSLPDGTCDEMVIGADGACRVERQTYHELFDGSQTYPNPVDRDGYQYVAPNSTKDKPMNANIHMLAVISDRFTTGVKAPGNVLITTGSVSGDGRSYIAVLFCFEPGTFADADEVRQWFTDNPTNVWFQGMQETEQLDTVQLPQLPAPTFNIYHDSTVPSDTAVGYERDINIAFDNLVRQVAGTASAVAVREASTIEEE